MTRECSVDGCTNPTEARGWCSAHFRRWERTGDVQADKPIRSYSSEARFVSTCKRCATEFVQVGNGRRRLYCSKECQNLTWREARSGKVQAARRCVYCGGPARSKRGRPICEACAITSKLRTDRGRTLRPHGITVADYDAMLLSQGGACVICGATEPGHGHSSFCVDHNHATGAVRGLLCRTCNVGLGQFADDPTRLRAAADYLEREPFDTT